MTPKDKKVLPLDQRMADLESSVQAVWRLFGLNPNNKPRSGEELLRVWARMQQIGAKKEWDEADTTSTVEFAWYLTQDDLKRLERLTEIQLCWLPLFQLLDMMRLRLIATDDFEGNYISHVTEMRIRGAIANLEKATQIYLLRYAPELHDAIQEHIHAFTDDLTPDFSPALAP